MSSISSSLSRVSSAMSRDLMMANLRRTNTALIEAQEQISTGKRINRPSDDAGAIGSVNILRQVLGQYDQQIKNLSLAQATVDTTDQAISDVSDLLLTAQNIASSQVGVGSTTETRRNEAQVIASQLQQLFDIANREVRGVHLFAGQSSDTAPFVEQFGGFRYIGAREDMVADLGLPNWIGVNSNGVDAFGALSDRIEGTVDLDPQLTGTTRLSDVAGGRGRGVEPGTIQLDVDGTDVDVDLAGADTAADVVTRINAAINDVDPTAGSLAIAGGGFELTANAGHSITIADVATGVTAADLGLDITATAGTTAGADLDPKLTELTAAGSFGAAVDFASGLKITNGGSTEVVSFAGAANVQEMINRMAAADVGVRMEINDAGTGFNLVNEVSGTLLSVGENSGGSTATDLGLRTMAADTDLAVLNEGLGVETAAGNDIRIDLHDGSSVEVDLSSAATIGDVIAAINAAGGGSVTAGLAADGNGLVLTDTTAGGGAFRVIDINNSRAAEDLGIEKHVGAAATLAGDDTAQIRTQSVFSHLMMLHEGLVTDDERLITLAGEKLNRDVTDLASARAQMGVRSQQISQHSERLEGLKIQNEALLSDIQDADLNEVITRFTQLQQQLQANMLSGTQLLRLSLLDFLR